jgi:leader peptidase (prepilin peptidase)/N-methyltransferase
VDIVVSGVTGLLAGYVTGTFLALILDRLYPGAPLRGPLHLGERDGRSLHAWAGTVGFLLAQGRCPSGGRLPARLCYLPLLGAGAGLTIARRAADGRHAALIAVVTLVLLAFVATDLERRVLPNRLMVPALVLAVVLSWAWPDRSAPDSVAGGVVGLAVMGTMYVIFPGFGLGDVKLATLLGLVSGASDAVPALLVAMLAGGIGGGALLVLQRAGPHSTMAYGPYLAIGAFVGMVWL